MCRAPISSYLRSMVLDSYIDRMVEHLSEELKQSRKQLVDERKGTLNRKKQEMKWKALSQYLPVGSGSNLMSRVVILQKN